jgi:hypothetical protein
MKTLVSLMMLLLAAASLRAQGTVEFKNLVAGGNKVQLCDWWPHPQVIDCPVEGYVVALFWAPIGTLDPNAFQQLGPAVPMVRPGYFSAGLRTIPEPFVGGADAFFLLRGWPSQYASIGEADEAATAMGPPYWGNIHVGMSEMWCMKTANPNAAPPDIPPAIGSYGFPGLYMGTLIPEPSILTLGLLGLAGWLLVRRMRR